MAAGVVPARDILRQVPERERAVALAAVDLPPAKPEIDLLLERGEASATVATRRLAGRIRTTIAELRDRLKAEAEQEQVTAQIAALRKQLDDAEAKLRRLRGIKPAPTVRVSSGVDTRKVRAWAIANNIQCSRAGILPASVLAAYRAAHGGGS
jgi:outer membrane protein TolC